MLLLATNYCCCCTLSLIIVYYLACLLLVFSKVVIIPGAEQKIVTDWQTEKPTEPVYRSLIQASGKLVLIDKLLPKLKESGHKVGTVTLPLRFHVHFREASSHVLCVQVSSGL